MHKDLRLSLEETGRDRNADHEKLRELLGEIQRSLSILPITVSDRLENLIGKFEEGVDKRVEGTLEDFRLSINEVRNKLWDYLQAQKHKSDKEDKADKAAVVKRKREEEVTGKFEVMKDGRVNMSLQFRWLKKIWLPLKWLVIVLMTGGGIHGVVTVIKNIFFHSHP